MRRFAVTIFLLLVFAAVYLVALGQSDRGARELPRSAEGAGTIPAPFLKVLALEYDGLASDLLFVDALVFNGETMERKTQPRMQEWEWRWLYDTFDAAAGVDPWFYDPYYFCNALIPWEGHLVKETNALLERGAKARDWDWTLPFYAGFNEFYFLNNNERAAELLMMSAGRPGAMKVIPTLAARLAYRGKRTENAIRFLGEFLATVEDPVQRRQYETRLEALKGIYVREQAVKAYQLKFNYPPLSLEELFFLELLPTFPADPYGGLFYLAPDGSVKTTSGLRPVR